MDLSPLDALGVALRALPLPGQVDALERVARWLSSERTRVYAALGWADRATAASVASRTGVPTGQAARQLQQAAAITALPEVAKALAAGLINERAAAAVADSVRHVATGRSRKTSRR